MSFGGEVGAGMIRAGDEVDVRADALRAGFADAGECREDRRGLRAPVHRLRRVSTRSGSPLCGSVAVMAPSRPAIWRMPRASIAHIAHTGGVPSSWT
jgi:hypothetical protein